ncbi:MAG: hypothetical protein II133_01720 [Lachnospiraceae bacterium]|nr:hypothetical protein [Lachnospiraceae bacterium]
MSSFTVTNNITLRNLYKTTDSSYSKQSTRRETPYGKLVIADTQALRKGISSLASEDYGDESEDTKGSKAEFYKKMKAFGDTYNYTLESSKKYASKDSKSAIKKMKQLASDYSDELEDLGVTFDDDGYMSMSESAFDNIDESRFEDLFGKGSDFMSQLDSIAKKLNRHIDVQA